MPGDLRRWGAGFATLYRVRGARGTTLNAERIAETGDAAASGLALTAGLPPGAATEAAYFTRSRRCCRRRASQDERATREQLVTRTRDPRLTGSLPNHAACDCGACAMLRIGVRIRRVVMQDHRALQYRADSVERHIRRDDEAGGPAVCVSMNVGEIAFHACARFQTLGGRREHLARAGAVGGIAVAPLVNLQRVIAIGRHAREIVGDLHTVRALDKR